MEYLNKGIGILVILSGVGHLHLALNYDNQSMFAQMIAGGLVYLLLGVLAMRNSKKAILASGITMLLASIGSSLTMNEVGYPIDMMMNFLVLNIAVIFLTVIYFLNVIRTRTN